MTVETDLYDTLAAAAGVTALVSTRIYPIKAPESATQPYIVYSLIQADRFDTLAGSGDPALYRFQIECIGTTYASSKSVAAAVIAALQGNGYEQSQYDIYDDVAQRHSRFVDWTFIAD